VPTRSEAPPAGPDAAGPRPDLRGHRLGFIALIERPGAELYARRWIGLAGGLGAGLAVGLLLLAAGAPSLLAVIPAAIVNLAVTLWLPIRLISAADRRLLGVVNHAAGAGVMSWRRAYGSAPIPRTEMARVLWMGAQPEDTTNPDALETEASILNSLGRYAEARDRAERLPDDTPWSRFARAFQVAAIEFESGGRGDVADARAAAEAVHGERRPAAISLLAVEDATRAMIRGDDWDPAIARAAAAAPAPIILGIAAALSRVPQLRTWLLASEVVLGAALYLLRDGVI
jgi:hypothetical protein